MSADYITISRTTSNVEPYQYVTIEIRKGAERVKVEMTPADFALAITGRGMVPVEVTHWPAAPESPCSTCGGSERVPVSPHFFGHGRACPNCTKETTDGR